MLAASQISALKACALQECSSAKYVNCQIGLGGISRRANVIFLRSLRDAVSVVPNTETSSPITRETILALDIADEILTRLAQSEKPDTEFNREDSAGIEALPGALLDVIKYYRDQIGKTQATLKAIPEESRKSEAAYRKAFAERDLFTVFALNTGFKERARSIEGLKPYAYLKEEPSTELEKAALRKRANEAFSAFINEQDQDIETRLGGPDHCHGLHHEAKARESDISRYEEIILGIRNLIDQINRVLHPGGNVVTAAFGRKQAPKVT